MKIPATYKEYARVICQHLEADYLEQPRVMERLIKAQFNPGEMSRLFNDLPHQPQTAKKLYTHFFEQGYNLTQMYQKMQMLVQTTLQYLLDNSDAIEAKLPAEHKDLFKNPTQMNYLIQAIITGYALELNAAFDTLPTEQQTRDRDEFVYFRTALDTLAQQLNAKNIFSTHLIEATEEAENERLNALSEIWSLSADNVSKIDELKETVSQSCIDLERYIEKNSTQLDHDKVDRLTSMISRLKNCQDSIHFQNEPFAKIHQEIYSIQQELKSLKQELKETRKNSTLSSALHQITKYSSPFKTISGINSRLDSSLNRSRPSFLQETPALLTTNNITKKYRALSDASTASTESSDNESLAPSTPTTSSRS